MISWCVIASVPLVSPTSNGDLLKVTCGLIPVDLSVLFPTTFSIWTSYSPQIFHDGFPLSSFVPVL